MYKKSENQKNSFKPHLAKNRFKIDLNLWTNFYEHWSVTFEWKWQEENSLYGVPSYGKEPGKVEDNMRRGFANAKIRERNKPGEEGVTENLSSFTATLRAHHGLPKSGNRLL